MVFFSQEEISGVLGSSWLDVQCRDIFYSPPPLLGSGSGLFPFLLGISWKNMGEIKWENQPNIHVIIDVLRICYYYLGRIIIPAILTIRDQC